MNTKSNIGFGLKAYLNTYPFLFLPVTVGIVVICFGCAEYILEYYNDTMINLIDPNSTKQ